MLMTNSFATECLQLSPCENSLPEAKQVLEVFLFVRKIEPQCSYKVCSYKIECMRQKQEL